MTSPPAEQRSRGAASIVLRVARASIRLSSERRLAALAALCLFLTLFLPWYTQSVITAKHPSPTTVTFTGFRSFSWVEAAVLVVAVGVLVLLFRRAEGRAFHLPGGDGMVITLAGGWTCFLVIWRMFDKQGVTRRGEIDLSTGITWGIFAALTAAAVLTYAGTKLRAARQPEPPLPTEDGAVFDGHWREPERATARSARGRGSAAPEAEEVRPAPARASRRSSWRPADAPEWSEPADGDRERSVGWLSRPARGEDTSEGEPSASAGGQQDLGPTL